MANGFDRVGRAMTWSASPSEVEVDVGRLGPLRKVATGGQGTVHELLDGPETLLYKEYSARVVTDVDVATLRRFVMFARELDEPVRRRLVERAAWPVNLVRRNGVVHGFLMPKAPRDFTVELNWPAGRDSVLAAVRYLLHDERYLADRGLEVTDAFRLEFLHDTVETMAMFHELGVVVGDLSPNNLLFSQGTRPRCFFLDCDRMRLGSDAVLAPVETPDRRVAGLGDERPATPAGDTYQVGLLAARLFAGDQHERDPGGLPVRVRDIAVSSLNPRLEERPAIGDWLRPLETALRDAPRQRAHRPRADHPNRSHTAFLSPRAPRLPTVPRPPTRPRTAGPPRRKPPLFPRRDIRLIAIAGGFVAILIAIVFAMGAPNSEPGRRFEPFVPVGPTLTFDPPDSEPAVPPDVPNVTPSFAILTPTSPTLISILPTVPLLTAPPS